MQNPTVLQIGSLNQWFDDRLAEMHKTHHLWKQDDAEAFLNAEGAQIDILVTSGRFGCSAEMIEAMPNLKAIISQGVGYDSIAIDAARARGIRVSNTPDVLNDCVADLAMTLILTSARQVVTADRYLREGSWAGGKAYPLASKVSGKRLGILGLGRIGQAVAKRAGGFDMEIRYHNRRELADSAYGYEQSLKDLASWADFLLVTCVGGPSTKGIVNAEVMEALGPGGTLVNVSRGSVVDEPAMVELLKAGKLGNVALDVYAEEPQVPAALIDIPRAVLLPHVGSGTVETRRAMQELVFENLARFVEDGELVTPIV